MIILLNQISFTLYHSRVFRGNLVLRHYVSHYPPSSGSIACWVAELNAALCLDNRAKKWKYTSKYFISSSGDRTHDQSILQTHIMPLRHDWRLLCINDKITLIRPLLTQSLIKLLTVTNRLICGVWSFPQTIFGSASHSVVYMYLYYIFDKEVQVFKWQN